MSLRIGDKAPDFTQDSSVGPLHWYEYQGNNWGIIFSHPADYTPVCTTELGEVSKRLAEFEKRNTKVAGLSVDSLARHGTRCPASPTRLTATEGWIKDINETQNTNVTYPIIADHDRKVAKLYGMLDQTNEEAPGLPLTVRAVFIIDPSKIIRLIIYYPASTGRNFHEVFRVLDSLQLSAKSVATPANWEPGQDVVVVPSVPTDKAKEIFGEVKVLHQ